MMVEPLRKQKVHAELMMTVRHSLLLLLACYALQAGSFSALPLLQGRLLRYSKNAARNPLGKGGNKAPLVQVPKEAVRVPSAPNGPAYKGVSADAPPAIRNHSMEPEPGKKLVKKYKSRGTSMNSIVPENISKETTQLRKASNKATNKVNKAPWTQQEAEMLRKLVAEAKLPVWSETEGSLVTPHVSWLDIGEKLRRSPSSCSNKYDKCQHQPKGHFTREEDALILQRVKQWGDKCEGKGQGKGLWSALALELSRAASVVRARWLTLNVEQTKRPLYWTEDMDAVLLSAREQYKSGLKRANTTLWTFVSNELKESGHEVTPRQCLTRYDSRWRNVAAGLSPKADWTPHLTTKLMQRRSEGAGWSDIGHELGFFPKTCETQWMKEMKKGLKGGLFSAEEDALIRAEVVRCGDPRQVKGFWPKLEKKMGRPAASLRGRWFAVLFQQDEKEKVKDMKEEKGEETVAAVKPAGLNVKSIVNSVKSIWNFFT